MVHTTKCQQAQLPDGYTDYSCCEPPEQHSLFLPLTLLRHVLPPPPPPPSSLASKAAQGVYRSGLYSSLLDAPLTHSTLRSLTRLLAARFLQPALSRHGTLLIMIWRGSGFKTGCTLSIPWRRTSRQSDASRWPLHVTLYVFRRVTYHNPNDNANCSKCRHNQSAIHIDGTTGYKL